MSDWVVVPVRGLASGKSRLAELLGPAERRALNALLLGRVLDAVAAGAGGLSRCIVASAEAAALQTARARGAFALADGAQAGLNPALEAARALARSLGAGTVLVLTADLPDVDGAALQRLREATPPGWASVVADRAATGTNALLLPAHCEFAFAFGAGSLARHRQALQASGVPVQVWADPALAFDLDTPADYNEWKEAGRA